MLCLSYLINHLIEFFPLEVIIVIFDVLDMDVWDLLVFLLVFLQLINRLISIPFCVFKRRHLLGINLQIVGVPATAVDE